MLFQSQRRQPFRPVGSSTGSAKRQDIKARKVLTKVPLLSLFTTSPSIAISLGLAPISCFLRFHFRSTSSVSSETTADEKTSQTEMLIRESRGSVGQGLLGGQVIAGRDKDDPRSGVDGSLSNVIVIEWSSRTAGFVGRAMWPLFLFTSFVLDLAFPPPRTFSRKFILLLTSWRYSESNCSGSIWSSVSQMRLLSVSSSA
jgi:hypothetical protein